MGVYALRRRIAPVLIIAAALLVAAAIILFGRAVSVSASNPFDITFPIAELGGCTSPDACKTYCDDLGNAAACATFARKHGLATETQVEQARELPALGPGGCNSESSCKSYCDDPSHLDECLAFAEEHNLLPREEIVRAKALAGKVGPGGCRGASCKDYCSSPDHQDECVKFAEENGLLGETELRDIKKGREILERSGGGPGGCRSPEQCRAYCDESLHLDECLDFGEKSGFLSKEEAARIRKLSGGGPGGCKGRAECEAYCNDPANVEACVTFAAENGLISKEEAERAKKFAGKAGPGGCRGDQCRSYCDDPAHGDECLAFAEREGLMPREEIERAKKFRSLAAQAGPGNCRGERECRTFCENPVNQDACFKFAKDEGLIPPEELARFERGKGLEERVKTDGGPGGCRDESSCFQYCSNSANTVACLNFAVEHGGFSREEANKNFEDWKRYREYGDQLRNNSDSFIVPEGQFGPPVGSRGFPPPIAGQVPPGFTPPGFGAPGFGPPGFSNFTNGPGGCSSPQECGQYCSKSENSGVCRDFFRGGKVEVVYQGPASVAPVEFGPGGCRGLSECLRYCQDPSHQSECSRFSTGPTPPGATSVLPGQVLPPVDAPRFCPQVFDPVCGVNRVTYGNRCEAGFVPVAYPGRCAESIQQLPSTGGFPGGCTTAECAQRYCSEPGRSQLPECQRIPIPQECPFGYRLEPLPQTGFTCRPVTESTGGGCTSEATCSAVCYNASILDYNSSACIAFRQSRQGPPPVGACPAGQYWYVSPGGGAGYCQSGTTPPPGGCPSGEQWDGARCVALSGGCVSESTCSTVCYNTTHPDYNASSCVAFRQSRTSPPPGGTGSCDQGLTLLLGDGCHYMYNDSSGNQIFCDGPMSKSAKRGDTAATSGCALSGTPGTPPSGQREQIWNSLGLRSSIRSDADPARIERLKQACTSVPSGSNVWMPGAGDYASPDFGMPDPAKCQQATSCPAGQYWNGTACASSPSTTCPSGQYWYVPPSGGAGYCKATSSTDCPSGQYWNGTSCVSSTASSCPASLVTLLGSGCHQMYTDSSGNYIYCDGPMSKSAKAGDTVAQPGCTSGTSTPTACPSGQYWYVPPSGGAGYCKATSSTDCPSGQYWNGTSCVSSTTTTCPSGQYWNGTACVTSTTTTGSCPAGWHSMASYCMSDSDSSQCQPSGGGATYPCSGTTSTTCPSGQYWNGTSCVSSTTTTCPSGQYWNGTSCVSSTTTTTCPSGQYWNGTSCVSSTTTTCPSDQYWNGTSCVTSTYTPPTTTTCPSDQYWNGTSCVPNTTSTYTPPTTTTCPSGQYWNGTACVSSSPPPQSLVGTIINAFVNAFVALFTR